MARAFVVGHERSPAFEILRSGRAQDQSIGFETDIRNVHDVFLRRVLQPMRRRPDAAAAQRVGDQNALMPVSSRPTTSSCTVSVPS